MFADGGVLWKIPVFLLPNLYGIIVLLGSFLTVVLLTILQQMLFFSKSEWSLQSCGLLLLKNGVVMLGGQYVGIIISLLLGFFAMMIPVLSPIASEFPMGTPQELLVNRLYAAVPVVLGVMLVFVGSFFITTRKLNMPAWKRAILSASCAVACGGCVVLGYAIMQ